MIHSISPIKLCDFYKTDHRRQYPEGTEYVYSNFTARYSRLPGVNHYVVFGVQYFVEEYLRRRFSEHFFNAPKAKVLKDYKRRMDTALGPNEIGTAHIGALHDLGYLPILVKALPEGTLCPMQVPCMTVVNTDPKFFWVTNFIETLLSNVVWHPMTSATIAFQYRKLLSKYAALTGNEDFVQWQGHDFSMRGQTSLESSVISAAAHLMCFTGTDTIPALDFLEEYYGADADKELIGGSVAATEHSVMCLGGKDTEKETIRRLLTEVYPKGIVSVVSDTWDYWHTLSVTLPSLKSVIMSRDGKLVVRPDSGDPVKILCGDETASDPLLHDGTIQVLWHFFGGTVNAKGYKELDPHIGVIYGDSITLERAEAICANLARKGFASTNVVFGIGSYTYQYVTRDTLGFAMKATWGQIKGQSVDVFKTPKTDTGTKHSAKGRLSVNPDLTLKQECSWAEEQKGRLEPVFVNGVVTRMQTILGIRKMLEEHYNNHV